MDPETEIQEIKSTIANLEKVMTATRVAIAELEARLVWSNSRQAAHDSQFFAKPGTPQRTPRPPESNSAPPPG